MSAEINRRSRRIKGPSSIRFTLAPCRESSSSIHRALIRLSELAAWLYVLHLALYSR